MEPWITAEDPTGVTITVQVIPRARKNQVVGPQGDALKLRVAAPPVEGTANEALIAFLAEALGLRKRDLSLRAGEHSRRKIVRIEGLDAAAVATRLLRKVTL